MVILLGKGYHHKYMERHGGKIRHLSVYLLKDILSFIVNFFLSFPKLVKGISHSLLHSKQGHGFTHVYISLRTGIISSSCTYDYDQDPSVEPRKNNDHPYKNPSATVDTTSFSESLGRNPQPLSHREFPLFPFESSSLNSTSTENSANISLSPTTLELKKPPSFSLIVFHGSVVTHKRLILFVTPSSIPLENP